MTVRTRTRALLPGKPGPVVTDEMKDLAAKHYLKNVEANESGRVAKKAREDLLRTMQAGGVEKFTHYVPTGDLPVQIGVAIETPETSKIDPLALWALMRLVKDPKKFEAAIDKEAFETFMGMVSVTKKAVQDQLGNAAATRCETFGTGTTNVNVKLIKN